MSTIWKKEFKRWVKTRSKDTLGDEGIIEAWVDMSEVVLIMRHKDFTSMAFTSGQWKEFLDPPEHFLG